MAQRKILGAPACLHSGTADLQSHGSRLNFYFLPFFLFSGLYLSFQILRDSVSTGEPLQTGSKSPGLGRWG